MFYEDLIDDESGKQYIEYMLDIIKILLLIY
jgi:hypothetical protein